MRVRVCDIDFVLGELSFADMVSVYARIHIHTNILTQIKCGNKL